ncbi:MAG: recombinase family protein [Ruminococcus sp.]|nr:recombinase family protein [Ruminococcus sp.]
MRETADRRVAAYCRVSTGKEEQLGSLASQRQFFEDYISSRKNWLCAGIYCDEGKSGTTTRRREGFAAMLRDCKAGLIDTIITKEVSRFARNTVDVLEYTRMLRRLGVNVIFLSDGIDTAVSDGELRLSIMACIAQEESRKTSDRVKWGQRRQMENGVVFGRDLLGYDVHDGALTINEPGAAAVRLIFRKYAIEGLSAAAVARELTALGISPMRQKKWSGTAILRVLRNEKYVGDLCQGKTFTPDPLDHRKQRQTDVSQLVCINSHHEPIISRELWELAQSRLAQRAVSRTRSGAEWCSGKVICGKCGRSFISRRKSLKTGSYLAWRCSGSQKAGGCGCNSVNDRVLLAGVNYILRSLALDTERLIREILTELASQQNFSACRLERTISDIRLQKLTLGRKLASGTISDADYAELNTALNAELSSFEAELEQLPKDAPDGRIEEFLRRKLTFAEPDIHICGEALIQAEVCPEKELSVKLKGLPCPVRLRYSTSGKGVGFAPHFELL